MSCNRILRPERSFAARRCFGHAHCRPTHVIYMRFCVIFAKLCVLTTVLLLDLGLKLYFYVTTVLPDFLGGCYSNQSIPIITLGYDIKVNKVLMKNKSDFLQKTLQNSVFKNESRI